MKKSSFHLFISATEAVKVGQSFVLPRSATILRMKFCQLLSSSMREFTRLTSLLACSRLSDSGDERKTANDERSTEGKKRTGTSPPPFFSRSRQFFARPRYPRPWNRLEFYRGFRPASTNQNSR